VNIVVLDTSIASFAFKASPLITAYRPHLEGVSYVVSFQTVAEMRFGARIDRWGVRRKRALELFLANLQVIEYSDKLADCWVEVMVQARRVGRRLEAGDAWVAATAMLLNAPLLTHDKDFDKEACPFITIVRYNG
jgi:predicted nucleic acid-binding protein